MVSKHDAFVHEFFCFVFGFKKFLGGKSSVPTSTQWSTLPKGGMGFLTCAQDVLCAVVYHFRVPSYGL